MRHWKLVIAVVCIWLLLLVGSYIWIIRPWHMHWGATAEEAAMVLPGDALIAPDAAVSTRAVTIHAPASTVWAWLVQTGQNRGGDWHSYVWLENLFAAEMHPLAKIDPTLPKLRVGDALYMHVSAADNPVMAVTVERVLEERLLVLRGGWTFMLVPLDERTTRLIVRYPMRPEELGHPLISFSIFEPAHFVMESGMMLGIKASAERDPFLESELARIQGASGNGTR